jgi:hypothetical protein
MQTYGHDTTNRRNSLKRAHLTCLDMGLAPVALFIYLYFFLSRKRDMGDSCEFCVCWPLSMLHELSWPVSLPLGAIFSSVTSINKLTTTLHCAMRWDPLYCALLCAKLLYLLCFVVACTCVITDTPVSNLWHQFRIGFVVWIKTQ